MVAFDNIDIEEANPVAKRTTSLSHSAKAWDINGDGVLDETELALREMDHGKKGTLTNGQIYRLMNENLTSQKEFFRLKKVMIV